MNRRNAIKLTAAAAASGLVKTAGLHAMAPQAEAPAGSPNVLFLMCDQVNARALGCYGGPIPTPNLDRICRKGVRFDSAICTYPVCSPSRASILTGLYPHTHGIVSNVDIVDYPTNTAPPTVKGITMQENTTGKILSQAGYDTHQYGKWHLHGDLLPWYPDLYGENREYVWEMADVFKRVRAQPPDTWLQWYSWDLPVTVNPKYREAVKPLAKRWENAHLVDFVSKAGRLDLPLNQLFDVRVADHAVAKLKTLTEKPFFITASMDYPHDPNVIPSPYYEMFPPDSIELPANSGYCEPRFAQDRSYTLVDSVGEIGLRELMHIYYGAVRLIDDQVGRILDALEQSGRLEDTVIVFTSDHGDMCGSHRMFWKSTQAFYDEVVRVPLLISYPRKVKPGVNKMPVSTTDIMPTLVDLAGQKVPANVEGRSLARVLIDKADTEAERPFVFSERITWNPERDRRFMPGMHGNFMIRGEGWKYVHYNDGAEYMYHLEKDPGEMHNLAADAATKCQKQYLRGKLNDWLDVTLCPAVLRQPSSPA